MKEKVINIASNADEYTLEIKKKLIKLLSKNGYSLSDEFDPEAELNITIGGDGAFLHAVRDSNFSEIPFVGINTGTLGFYPEIVPENMEKFVEDYISGSYKINEMNIIECRVYTNEKISKIYAINDIAIKRRDMKTIHLNVFIDSNKLETISGDGLIISSPMGSSGYNLSSGGSLVYPSLKTLQISPLSPIISNAYRCLDCSIIVPPEFEITIYPEYKDNFHITFLADGVAYDYDNLECASFQTSQKTVKRISTGKFNYWNVIKEKFL
jgi:NAD+ kinase